MAPDTGGRHAKGAGADARGRRKRSRSSRSGATGAPLSRSVRAPAARHFQAGKLRADGPGSVLRCLVLVPGPEWVAIDLDSGALVRAHAGSQPGQPDDAGTRSTVSGDGDMSHGVDNVPPWPERSLQAVELRLGVDPEPPDPARPEAIVVSGRPVVLGEPRRRTTRRLLRQVVTKASDRPLLGTLGPSIAYGDLDGTRPSVVIVAPQARPRFGVGPTGPWCQFALGGRRHTMPCSEHAAPDPSATGHGTKLLVVALGAPRRGQVPKMVLGTLPLGR